MKVPLGHKLKIMKRAQQLKNVQIEEKEEEKAESEAPVEKELPVKINHPNNHLTKRKVEIANKHSIGIGTIPEENNVIEEEDVPLQIVRLKDMGERDFDFNCFFAEGNVEEIAENDGKNTNSDENYALNIKNETTTTFDENNIEVKKECVTCWQCLQLKDGVKMIRINEKVIS